MNTDAKSEMNLELIDFLNSNEFKVDNLPICVYLSILRLLIEKVEGDADSLPHVRVPTKAGYTIKLNGTITTQKFSA